MTSTPYNPPTALVLEIQRLSTEDGPGIRTTVFFKGCSLRCSWCHNPESIGHAPQIQWIESRCMNCRSCVAVCPEKALSTTGKGILIDRARCRGCGTCAEECPAGAMELWGKRWTVDELLREVAKDEAYFGKSGGGVTASGGEATLQAEFVALFFETLRARGIATALDTCGQCSREALKKILPHSNMVLYDLKEIDPARHRRFTGVDNQVILDNLLFVRDAVLAVGDPRELWIRTPIIPGATASKENIRGIGRFIADNLSGAVTRWDLCAFNNLCRDKYLRLGLEWEFRNADLIDEPTMSALKAAAETSGVDPQIVRASGAVKR